MTVPLPSSSSTASLGESEVIVETEVDIKQHLADAEELKQEGNDYFRSAKWDQALNAYRTALGRLPKRKQKGKATENHPEDPEESIGDGDDAPQPERPQPTDSAGASTANDDGDEIDIECAKARAVLNANIAACYVKLNNHKEAVKACTDALHDDPRYVKALQRRAISNEQIGSWSSLTSAQEDYQLLLTLLPPQQTTTINRSLQSLKPRIEVAQKAETAEMLSKLKGLGNSILGNFGLSTDNFKFEPNGQGGYSMNFSQ